MNVELQNEFNAATLATLRMTWVLAVFLFLD